MTPLVVFTAVVAAVAAGLLVAALVPSPRRLAPRVARYSTRTRSHFGRPLTAPVTGTTSVWGPIVSALANALASLVDASRSEETALRITQAGMSLSVEDYRRRQLLYAVGGLVVGFVFAGILQLAAVASLLIIGLGAMMGLTRWRATVDRRIRLRRETMEAETHVVCQLLAIYLRTGDTPQTALAKLVERTSGNLSDDLAVVVDAVRAGRPGSDEDDTAQTAGALLDQRAGLLAAPAAARLYRLYGATWPAGGDPAALLALGEDLRAGRRDTLERLMAKRRTAMIIPLVVVLGPIMLLYIGAPLPSLIFGR